MALNYAKSLILGVDPGLSGALVWYSGDKREIVEVIPMPLTFLRATGDLKEGKKKNQNLASLALSLSRLAPKTRLAVIEDVHAMPDQGVVSMFRFGQSVGQIQGLIASHFIPFFLVTPQVWKSIFQLSSDKLQSLSMARQLFPKQAGYFSRAKDDGIAEACLLAVYGHLYFDRKDLDSESLDDRPLKNDA